MSIVSNNDIYQFYKYIPADIQIIINDVPKKIDPVRLNSLIIIDDYIENIYPVFKIDLSLENELYYEIVKNKDNVKFFLRIQKFYRENTSKEQSMKTDYISDTFSLILNDEDNNLGKDIRKQEYPEGEDGKMDAITTLAEFFLFKSDLIYANRTLVNRIFSGANVGDVINWLLTKADAKKILISKPDNQNIFPEIIVPPMPIAESLVNLDSFYGIHNTGSIIYFGYNRGYILKFLTKQTVFSEDEKETICFLVPKIGSYETDNICQLKKPNDTEKIYVIVDPISFKPSNEEITDRSINSEQIVVVNSDSREIERHDASTKNQAVFIKPGQNPYYSNIFKTYTRAREKVIDVSFQDIDVSNITPNKNYQFIFEETEKNKEYSGIYVMTFCSIGFVKQGEEFTAGVNALFRKVPDNSEPQPNLTNTDLFNSRVQPFGRQTKKYSDYCDEDDDDNESNDDFFYRSYRVEEEDDNEEYTNEDETTKYLPYW